MFPPISKMFTTIITAHNNFSTIAKAIVSAAKHSKRIIVVDLASTDETVELVGTYPQVELITTEDKNAYLDLLYYHDWFLILNADEELIEIYPDVFEAPYCFVRIEQDKRVGYQPRLFRYKPGMRFIGNSLKIGFDYFELPILDEVVNQVGVIKGQPDK